MSTTPQLTPFALLPGQWFGVQVFKERGPVIHSHIWDGEDFFKTDKGGDVIISNPPFSKKDMVFERLKVLDRPFAMLVPLPGLFEGPRFELFADYGCEVMVFNKRINFTSNGIVQKSPPFACCYICHGILPSELVFRRLVS